jgi:hypothetical protein
MFRSASVINVAVWPILPMKVMQWKFTQTGLKSPNLDYTLRCIHIYHHRWLQIRLDIISDTAVFICILVAILMAQNGMITLGVLAMVIGCGYTVSHSQNFTHNHTGNASLSSPAIWEKLPASGVNQRFKWFASSGSGNTFGMSMNPSGGFLKGIVHQTGHPLGTFISGMYAYAIGQTLIWFCTM